VCLAFFGHWFYGARRDLFSPPNPLNADERLAQSLCALSTAEEPVYLNLEGMTNYWNPAFVPGYPQIYPVVEYYAGRRPILCFTSEAALATDLKELLRLGEPGSFSPVLITRDPARMKQILECLCEKEVIAQAPHDCDWVDGRQVLDLTPYLR
jgi:hypothetical protein